MIYDVSKTFHENISHELHTPISAPFERVSRDIKLFDYEILSPVGLFACPFSATSKGVELASQYGFDVITWKTIRSCAHEPHPWPNLAYVYPPILREPSDYAKATTDKQDKKEEYMLGSLSRPAVPGEALCEAWEVREGAAEISLANSIGNASYALEPTLQEIKKGLGSMQEGQILISSIYGTGQTRKEIINDFVYLAERVSHIGVHAIELNCSCPNVSGAYYKDTDFMRELVVAVSKAVSIPITVKVGIHDSYEQLEQLLITIAQAGARGITGINAIGMKILNEEGAPFFGEKRLYAGVSGDAIRARALAWVQDVATINTKHTLGLAILGGGGIVAADQFDQFLNAGAHVGMTASGALLDPNIAINYHRTQYEKRNPHTVARSEHVI